MTTTLPEKSSSVLQNSMPREKLHAIRALKKKIRPPHTRGVMQEKWRVLPRLARKKKFNFAPLKT